MSKLAWAQRHGEGEEIVATLWRQFLGCDSANTNDRILPTLSAQSAARSGRQHSLDAVETFHPGTAQ